MKGKYKSNKTFEQIAPAIEENHKKVVLHVFTVLLKQKTILFSWLSV
jgi:hypothetical protein